MEMKISTMLCPACGEDIAIRGWKFDCEECKTELKFDVIYTLKGTVESKDGKRKAKTTIKY